MIEANLGEFNDAELREIEQDAREHVKNFPCYREAYRWFYQNARDSLVNSFNSPCWE